MLDYLPSDAVMHAKVYPVIKPGANSFVWELSSDPTIFLYLNPEVSCEKFENTVTHELHHIGLGSVGPIYDKKIAALREPALTAANWIGAFGEGFAMLGAAGGPDIDPHAASSPKEHARWEHDMGQFNGDLQAVNQFFLDVLNAKFASSDAIEEKGKFFLWHPRPVVHGWLQDVGDGGKALWPPGIDRHYARSALPARTLQPRRRRAERRRQGSTSSLVGRRACRGTRRELRITMRSALPLTAESVAAFLSAVVLRRFTIRQMSTAASSSPNVARMNTKCWENRFPVMATIPGPNQRVSSASIRKRTNRPAKIASRKWPKFISNAAAASTTTLKGVGGGSIAGNITAQNSCLSNDAWIFSNRSGDSRLRSSTSPPV